jgi:hypothetical protein
MVRTFTHSVKGYIEMFHVMYKRDVPSNYCNMRLDWSVSTRERDSLDFILIDLHGPEDRSLH